MQLPFAGMVPPERLALFAVVVTVPAPQVVDALGTGATASDATGSVSVNAAAVSATPLGLVNVIVTVDGVPPPCRLAGAKALAPVTGRSAATVSVADAACALAPCEEVTAFAGIVLMNTPAVSESTSTCTVHCPATRPTAAGIVPPEKEKLPVPEVAVTVPPTHVVDAFGVAAMTTVPGRLSVNVAAVAAAGLLLIRMTVSVDDCPAETLIGLKVLLTPIAANATAGTSRAVASSALRANFMPRNLGPPTDESKGASRNRYLLKQISRPAGGENITRNIVDFQGKIPNFPNSDAWKQQTQGDAPS